MMIEKKRTISVLLQCVLFLSGMSAFCDITVDQQQRSVVKIITSGLEGKSGTGFFLSPTRVVTCLHVVTGNDYAQVEMRTTSNDAVSRKGKVIARKPKSDLALIELDSAITQAYIPILSFSTPPGETLTVLGYPFPRSLPSDNSIRIKRTGYSEIGQIFEAQIRNKILASPILSTETKLLDIDGSFLPGHSGSPLYDRDGAVVGIADGGMQNGSNIASWAIAASELRDIGEEKYRNVADLGIFERMKLSLLMVDEKNVLPESHPIKVGNLEFKDLRVSVSEVAKENTTSNKLYDAISNYIHELSLTNYSDSPVTIYGSNSDGVYFAVPKIEGIEFDDYSEPYDMTSFRNGLRAEFMNGDIIFDLAILNKQIPVTPEFLSTAQAIATRKLTLVSKNVIDSRSFKDNFKSVERNVNVIVGSSISTQYELFHTIVSGKDFTAELTLLDKNRIATFESIKRERLWARLVLSTLFLFLD